MPDELAERSLARAWQQGLPGPLRLTDGRALSVVYRGRCPGGGGPDVRGALLAFANGQLLEGDVEFHQRTSDWVTHGHHRDDHYRGVILHVVLVDDAAGPVDSTGQPVPTLVVTPDVLARLQREDETFDRAEVCHRAARERGADALGPLLDELGDRRLIQRAARFEAELTRLTPEQLAHEAVFDALGFSRNRAPFVRLAQAAPIGLLAALLGRRSAADALVLAEALLFGVAGLLPSQRPNAPVDWEGDAMVEDLEAAWALYRRDWDGLELAVADWTFGGVRPANYPTRRIATAARLLLRHQADGLDRALLAPLRRHAMAAPVDLEGLFLVEGAGSYWSTHCDFGRPLPGEPAALLGHDRARDAVVNVVLPLALAVAAWSGERSLADAAWSIYRAFPRPSAYAATRKLSVELGLADRQVATARRQQGLLYLLRHHCEEAGCARCPLGQRLR